MDKFDGKFRIEVSVETWGHGEVGYALTIFSSHSRAEVEKAKAHLLDLIERFEQLKPWTTKIG